MGYNPPRPCASGRVDPLLYDTKPLNPSPWGGIYPSPTPPSPLGSKLFSFVGDVPPIHASRPQKPYDLRWKPYDLKWKPYDLIWKLKLPDASQSLPREPKSLHKQALCLPFCSPERSWRETGSPGALLKCLQKLFFDTGDPQYLHWDGFLTQNKSQNPQFPNILFFWVVYLLFLL